MQWTLAPPENASLETEAVSRLFYGAPTPWHGDGDGDGDGQ